MSSFEKPSSLPDSLDKKNKVSERETETREDVAESVLERAIELSWKVNEGNNGIVCLLEMEKMEEGVKEALCQLNERIREKESLANKVLKIYRPGEGEKEFALQKECWESIESSPDKDKMMQIPEPLIFQDVAVKTKEAQNRLEKWGFKLPTFTLPKELAERLKEKKEEIPEGLVREIDFTEKGLKIINEFIEEEKRSDSKKVKFKLPEVRAELFLMDSISGEDLATILYREVIKRHPGASDWGNSSEGMSIDQLQDKIAQIFDFKRPGGKHARGEDKIFEEEMVKRQNASEVRKYLIKETDFMIDSEQFDKIEKTITHLNKEGFYHRDLHERNIMFDEQGEVYMIDFGSAKKEKTARDSVYEEGEKVFIRDRSIINKLKIFTNPQEKRQGLEKTEGVQSDFKHLNNVVWRVGGEEWRDFLAELPEKKLTPAEADSLLEERSLLFFKQVAGKQINDLKEMELRIKMFLVSEIFECLPEEVQSEWAEKYLESEGKKYSDSAYLLGKLNNFRYWLVIEKGLTVRSGRGK